MDEAHKRLLQTNMMFFLDDLKPDSVIDKLYSRFILTSADYDRLWAQPTERCRIRQLILILQKSGPDAFDSFVDALKCSDQEHVVRKLLRPNAIGGDLHENFDEVRNEADSHVLEEDTGNAGPSQKRKLNSTSVSEFTQISVLSKKIKLTSTDSTDLTQTSRISSTSQNAPGRKTKFLMIGYIHNLQKKRKSRKGNWYSSFMVQTDPSTYQRCLTFCPGLHKEILEEYEAEKTPVCLTGCSIYESNQQDKYIDDEETPTINEDTEFERGCVTFHYEIPGFTFLADIPFGSGYVDIRVKVEKEEEPTKKDVNGEKMEMQEKYVTDSSGITMKLTAWRHFVGLKVGQQYSLRNVSYKVYNLTNNRVLSTNQDTTLAKPV